MSDVHLLQRLASRQQGCVARWQLIAGGWSTARCDHALSRLTRIHDGVYISGFAAPTLGQRRWAATLTTSATALGLESAGCAWQVITREPALPTVVRPGRRGVERLPDLVVRYSATLSGNVTRLDGFWVTTAERTVIDLWPRLRAGKSRERMLRDAIRLQRTATTDLQRVLDAHRGRRGTATLRSLLLLYERLPLDRCRSDPEVEGLVVLDAAGVALPRVNVRIAGEEADFSWLERRLIIEIDGPSFHQDKLADARKAAVWVRAGWTVLRISSDDVYLDPGRLIAMALSGVDPATA